MKEYRYRRINAALAGLLSVFVIFSVILINFGFSSPSRGFHVGGLLATLIATSIPLCLLLNYSFGLKNPALTLGDDHFIIPRPPKAFASFLDGEYYSFFTNYEKVYFNSIIEMRKFNSKRGEILSILTKSGRYCLRQSQFAQSDYPEIVKYFCEKTPAEFRDPPKGKFAPFLFYSTLTAIYWGVYFFVVLDFKQIPLGAALVYWVVLLIYGAHYGSSLIASLDRVMKR